MIKNKKGWIKIVEAFISILIIISVVLILYNKGEVGTKDLSSEIYPIERTILKEIELNADFRNKILEINDEKLPVEWENFTDKNGYQLASLRAKIISRLPNNLECSAKICELSGEICDLNSPVEKNIYAQSVSIAADVNTYNPRQLKLFCSTK